MWSQKTMNENGYQKEKNQIKTFIATVESNWKNKKGRGSIKIYFEWWIQKIKRKKEEAVQRKKREGRNKELVVGWM